MDLEVKLKPALIGINFNKFIFQKVNFVPEDICKKLRTFIDNSDGTHIRGSKNPNLWKANFSTCLLMDQSFEIYDVIKKTITEYNSVHHFKLSFLEIFEIKKYYTNDFFEPHVDNYFGTDLNEDIKLNIIVQLSDQNDYEGGELTVGLSKFEISKSIGTVTIFPANYIHEVSRITKGCRYSMITHAWGPEFK